MVTWQPATSPASYAVAYREDRGSVPWAVLAPIAGVNVSASADDVMSIALGTVDGTASFASNDMLRLGVGGIDAATTSWLPINASADDVASALRALVALRGRTLTVAPAAAPGAGWTVTFTDGIGSAPPLLIAETTFAAPLYATAHRDVASVAVCTADTVAATGAPCSHAVTGLLPGRVYQFRVRARDGAGVDGSWATSEVVRIAAPSPADVGAPPGAVMVASVEPQEVGTTHVVVRVAVAGAWAPSDVGVALQLELATTPGAWRDADVRRPPTLVSGGGGPGGAILQYAVRADGLAAGAQYAVRARVAFARTPATDTLASRWYQAAARFSTTPAPPPPPTLLPWAGADVSTDGATLRWSAPPDPSGSVVGFGVEGQRSPTDDGDAAPPWLPVPSAATRAALLGGGHSESEARGTRVESADSGDAVTIGTHTSAGIACAGAPLPVSQAQLDVADAFAAASARSLLHAASGPMANATRDVLTAVAAGGGGHGAAANCTYTLRVSGLTPTVAYRFRVRTLLVAARDTSLTNASAASGALGQVDAGTLILGSWTPPSARVRIRTVARGRRPVGGAAAVAAAAAAAAATLAAADGGVPAPPALVGVTDAAVRVTWRPFAWRSAHDAAVAQPAVGYILELSHGAASESFVTAWEGGPGAERADLDGLRSAAEYRVRMLAVGVDGERTEPSAPLAFATLPAAAAAPAAAWRRLRPAAARDGTADAARWSGGGAAMLVQPPPGRPGQLRPPALRGATLTLVGGQYLYLHGGTTPGYDCAVGGARDACRAGAGARADTWRLGVGDGSSGAEGGGDVHGSGDDTNAAWLLLQPAGGVAPPPRERHAAVAVDGGLLVWGGRGAASPTPGSSGGGIGRLLSDVWFLDIAGGGRRRAGASNRGDGSHASVHGGSTLPLRTTAGAAPADASCAAGAAPCGLPVGAQTRLPLDVAEAPDVAGADTSSVPAGSCVASLRVFVEWVHASPRDVRATLVGPRGRVYRAQGASVDEAGAAAAAGSAAEPAAANVTLAGGAPDVAWLAGGAPPTVGGSSAAAAAVLVDGGAGCPAARGWERTGLSAATNADGCRNDSCASSAHPSAYGNGTARRWVYAPSPPTAVGARVWAADGDGNGNGAAADDADAGYVESACRANRSGACARPRPAGSQADVVVFDDDADASVYAACAAAAAAAAAAVTERSGSAATERRHGYGSAFDDSARGVNGEGAVPVAPLLGGRRVRPRASLTRAFAGVPVAGRWMLVIDDDGPPPSATPSTVDVHAGGHGEVRRWGILLTSQPCVRTPVWTPLTVTAVDATAGAGTLTATAPPALADAVGFLRGRTWFVAGGRGDDVAASPPPLWALDVDALVWRLLVSPASASLYGAPVPVPGFAFNRALARRSGSRVDGGVLAVAQAVDCSGGEDGGIRGEGDVRALVWGGGGATGGAAVNSAGVRAVADGANACADASLRVSSVDSTDSGWGLVHPVGNGGSAAACAAPAGRAGAAFAAVRRRSGRYAAWLYGGIDADGLTLEDVWALE